MKNPLIFKTLLSLSFLCVLNATGQKIPENSHLDESEINTLRHYKQLGVDTMLIFRFQPFSYNLKDSSHKSMFLWKQNGIIYKEVYKDSITNAFDTIKDNDFFEYYFTSDLNSRKNHKKQKRYWEKRHIWINPLSSFYEVTFCYKNKSYREMLLEGNLDVIKGDFHEAYFHEISWFKILYTEMTK